MLLLDTTSYFVAIGIIFLTVYLISPTQLDGRIKNIVVVLKNRLAAILANEHLSKGVGDDSKHALNTSEPSLASGFSPDCITDEKFFQLERRAIFSKTWLFVAHANRFQKPGDYRTFEIAGFSILVILGKDGIIRSFQNVCRHRAYQITKKECGTSTVLRCRYHGWSYNSKGSLIKAPEFENVVGFNKSKNGLWEVKTEVRNSIIFVNLDASDNVQSLDVKDLGRVLENCNWKDFRCVADWKIDGRFNWKLAVENFEKSSSDCRTTTLSSLLLSWLKGRRECLSLGYTALIRQVSSDELVTFRLLPKSTAITTVECCIYTRKESASAKVKQNLEEDMHLEIKILENKQRRLLRGKEDFSFGKMPSFNRASTANRSTAHQNEINRIMKEHAEAERTLGAEIYPPAQKQFSAEGMADDEFCRGLQSLSGSSNTVCSDKSLEW